MNGWHSNPASPTSRVARPFYQHEHRMVFFSRRRGLQIRLAWLYVRRRQGKASHNGPGAEGKWESWGAVRLVSRCRVYFFFFFFPFPFLLFFFSCFFFFLFFFFFFVSIILFGRSWKNRNRGSFTRSLGTGANELLEELMCRSGFVTSPSSRSSFHMGAFRGADGGLEGWTRASRVRIPPPACDGVAGVLADDSCSSRPI